MDTKKTHYISRSDIAFNVKVGGGVKHIRFDSLSDGGSRYSTADPRVIEALERHPWNGKLFRNENAPAKKKKAVKDEPKVEEKPVVVEIPAEEPQPTVYDTVTYASEAKNILSKHGVEPKSLHSKAEIRAKAAELGISFPNL